MQIEKNLPEFVKHLLTSLVNFRRAFSLLLRNSDKLLVDLWIGKLEKLKNVPAFNDHFIDCPWTLALLSSPTSSRDYDVPDTCGCCVPAIIDFKYELMCQDYDIHLLWSLAGDRTWDETYTALLIHLPPLPALSRTRLSSPIVSIASHGFIYDPLWNRNTIPHDSQNRTHLSSVRKSQLSLACFQDIFRQMGFAWNQRSFWQLHLHNPMFLLSNASLFMRMHDIPDLYLSSGWSVSAPSILWEKWK